MNIPDAAVEAAFSSIVGGNEATGPDIAGDFLTREQLRTLLEASAPHLMAVAWDEGCHEGLEWRPEQDYKALEQNPYRSAGAGE